MRPKGSGGSSHENLQQGEYTAWLDETDKPVLKEEYLQRYGWNSKVFTVYTAWLDETAIKVLKDKHRGMEEAAMKTYRKVNTQRGWMRQPYKF